MTRINISEQSDGLEESRARQKAALETVKESWNPPMSPSDHRAKALAHERKADQLVSGDAKDSHLVAARLHKKAADAIEAAFASTAKCDALE